MRIVDNNNIGNTALGQTARTAETQPGGSTGKGSAKVSSATDGIQISQFTGTLSKVLESDSTSRAQRVERLAAAVRSGTYQVDPMAVSRAIVDHAISTGH